MVPEPTVASLLSLLRRHRWSIASCIALAAAGGAGYTAVAPRVYEATSVLRFQPEQINLPRLVQPTSSENAIGTEMGVLKGRSAAAAVVDSLALRARVRVPRRATVAQLFPYLNVAPDADTMTLLVRPLGGGVVRVALSNPDVPAITAKGGDTVQYRGVRFTLSPTAMSRDDIRLQIVTTNAAVERFSSALTVSRPARDADLLVVDVRADNPQVAAAAANLLTRNVIDRRREMEDSRTGSTVRFLRQQLDTLRRLLHDGEETLRASRERVGIVDADEQGKTQVRRLAQIEADRGGIDAERRALARLIAQIDSAGTPGDTARSAARRLISFPTLFRNQAVAQLLAELARIENERAALIVRRTTRDPDVQVLTSRVVALDAELKGIAETYLQGLTNQVAALDSVAHAFGRALDSIPGKELQTARLERDVLVQQQLYTLIQTRLKEAEATQAMEDPTVRVADPAVAPDRPVRPILALNLGVALILGTIVGIGLALARNAGDTSVRSRADAMMAAGLPVMGAIPRAKRAKQLPKQLLKRDGVSVVGASLRKANASEPAARIASLLVTCRTAPAAQLEAFRQLYVNLGAAAERWPKVVVVTSPLPGEGKTLTAINLALTLALQGQRVLLIDADYRCGLVGDVFGCDRRAGFVDLMSGTGRPDEAICEVELNATARLAIISSGASRPQVARLDYGARLRGMLDECAQSFDLVLVDTPPVNVLADAALIGRLADAVLLVARAGHTQANALSHAMDQLSVVRAPVVGTVLNDIDAQRNGDDDTTFRYFAEVERYYTQRGTPPSTAGAQ